MTTLKTTINTQAVATILNNASWSYQHCGDRIKEGDMDEYISEIEAHEITKEDVDYAIKGREADIFSEFENNTELDINELSARFVADAVAQQIVDCVYSTVSFVI